MSLRSGAADRLPRRPGGRGHPLAGRSGPAHLRQDVRDAAGSRSTTRPSTARTPFNANALAKATGGTPFKRPENGVFRPGSKFTRVLLRRDRRHERRAPRRARSTAASARSSSSPRRPDGEHGHAARCFYRGDARTPASTTSRSSTRTTYLRRGRRRRPARAAQRPGLRLAVRRRRATTATRRAAGPHPRRGPRPRPRRSTRRSRRRQRIPERGRQRDHGHPRLRRRPDGRRACSAPQGPQPFQRLAALLHAAAR